MQKKWVRGCLNTSCLMKKRIIYILLIFCSAITSPVNAQNVTRTTQVDENNGSRWVLVETSNGYGAETLDGKVLIPANYNSIHYVGNAGYRDYFCVEDRILKRVKTGSEFTDHHIGTQCGICGDFQLRAEISEKNRDDERTAGKTELDRLRNARELDRKAAEDDTDHDTEEDRNKVRMAEAGRLVSEESGYLVHRLFRSYDQEAVSHVEIEVRAGYEFHARPEHTGH